MLIDKSSFHDRTQAIFQYVACDLDSLLNNYGQPYHLSISGSQYWYLEDRVIRWSDHWGKVKGCKWTMSRKMKHQYKLLNLKNQYIAGYCLYNSFISINIDPR